MTEQEDMTKYDVTWYVDAYRISKRRMGSIGVCGYSKKMIRFAYGIDGFPDWMFLVDVFVGKQTCEEERRCLSLECSLNKTSAESLFKSLHLPKSKNWSKRFENLIRRSKEINRLLPDADLPLDGQTHIFTKPCFTILGKK